jgi:hypothetical protein
VGALTSTSRPFSQQKASGSGGAQFIRLKIRHLDMNGQITIKKPAQWRVHKFWQHIKLASNIAYFVAFCKPD